MRGLALASTANLSFSIYEAFLDPSQLVSFPGHGGAMVTLNMFITVKLSQFGRTRDFVTFFVEKMEQKVMLKNDMAILKRRRFVI